MELKTIGLTKKFGSKNCRERFEYYIIKRRLRLVGCKWRRKNYIYAAAL